MQTPSPLGWTISLGETHSVRATSPDTAPTSTCHQRTRQFAHDLDPALPPPPPGALAGGANSQPAPDFPYDPRLSGSSTAMLLPR